MKLYALNEANTTLDLKSLETSDIDKLFEKALDYYFTPCKEIEAYYIFRKIHERHPNYIHRDGDNPYSYLANICRSLDDIDLETVLKLYSKAIELKPDYGDGYLSRALVYLELGNLHKALDDFEHVLNYQGDIARDNIDLISSTIRSIKNIFNERRSEFLKSKEFLERKEEMKKAIKLTTQTLDTRKKKEKG